MKEIDNHRKISEKPPAMIPPLIQHLDYNNITDFGGKIILGMA